MKEVTTAEIQKWLISYLANLLQVCPDDIDISIPFNEYDSDSSAAVDLISDLSEWLGCDLAPTVVYNYPTVKTLARHLDTVLHEPNQTSNTRVYKEK